MIILQNPFQPKNQPKTTQIPIPKTIQKNKNTLQIQITPKQLPKQPSKTNNLQTLSSFISLSFGEGWGEDIQLGIQSYRVGIESY